MNHVDFSQPNGFPLESDATLGFMQDNYVSAVRSLAAACGSNVIVSGLVLDNGVCTDGWIVFEGDLVKFSGGIVSDFFHLIMVVESRANENGVLVERYFTKRALFGQHHTLPNYRFAELRRIAPQNVVQRALSGLAALENEVVLSGCAVAADFNTGVFSISEGVVMIDGVFLESPRLDSAQGTWYLIRSSTDKATFVNGMNPNSGAFILFTMYGTSQYYQDILIRHNAYLGELRLMAILSSDFDANGLGLNRMKGWAICNGFNGTVDMGGRFPVGYRGSTPDYGVIGNIGGSEVAHLTIQNMPAHNHQNGQTGTVGRGESGLMRRPNTGDRVTTTTFDVAGGGTEPDIVTAPTHIPLEGEGKPFGVMPPFRVLVYIQCILI